MIINPRSSEALEVAVGASSTTFGAAMVSGAYYQYTANVASWISQGDTPTASAGAGSMFVPAGVVITLAGSAGADLAVIRDSSSGKATLTPTRIY